MAGMCAISAKGDCIDDVFYCTDYHSHLGTEFGGLAVLNGIEMNPFIRDIRNNDFRSRFKDFVSHVSGDQGIGVISDFEPQPLLFNSPFGAYALAHVGKVRNVEALAKKQREGGKKVVKISDRKIGKDRPSPIGVMANLINQGRDIVDGIEIAQNEIEGSASLMLLTEEGVYVARDRLGRTPIAIGKKEEARIAASETCCFPTRGFETERFLGPGEIGILTDGIYKQLKKPEENMQICSFLWVYYGFPASSYEGKNVEVIRNLCGAKLAERDSKRGIDIDLVAGIPDSGTAHSVGYAIEAGIPFKRPYVKYADTWQRSFMPQEQKIRHLIADMKLIPIKELIQDLSLMMCDDSVVRGTQLRDKVRQLFDYGAREVHVRPACPPLLYTCDYLNFSRPSKEMDLAGRRAVAKLEGLEDSSEVEEKHIAKYLEKDPERHESVVELIGKEIGATSLHYQKLGDLVSAIGLPKEKLCTYCWDGCRGCE